MSAFSYNGISVPFAAHVDFSQEAAYDQSNTDRTCVKFDITVQGILTPSLATVAGMNPALAGNAPQMMEYIRARLLEPRQTLRVTFDGQNLLPQEITGTDAANGPHPQACKILRLTTTTFLISFRIVTHLVEYGDGDTQGGPVVSNRWEETQSIDGCNYISRTRRGSYTIRSDNLSKAQADELRSAMCILAIPVNFEREHAEYSISRDGLTLSFAITDKQIYLQPPYPAFKADGDYDETSTKLGTARAAQCWVRLEGDPFTDKALLMRTAVEVCGNQLLVASNKGGAVNNIARIDSCEVKHALYRNVVECRMRAIVNPWWRTNQPQARLGGVAGIDFNMLTKAPLGSEPGSRPPLYRDRGSMGGNITPVANFNPLVLAAQYYDAQVGAKLNKQTGQLTAGTPIGTGRGN